LPEKRKDQVPVLKTARIERRTATVKRSAGGNGYWQTDGFTPDFDMETWTPEINSGYARILSRETPKKMKKVYKNG
jgi:tRNA U34 5-methylaminomethyl-2-thiouridine-forming methyltransferase MnmC